MKKFILLTIFALSAIFVAEATAVDLFARPAGSNFEVVSTAAASTPAALPAKPALAQVTVWLRESAQCDYQMVTLGEIAVIGGTDELKVRQLKALQLFPAPSVGRICTVQRAEIADLLILQGVARDEIQLGGSAKVAISLSAKASRISQTSQKAQLSQKARETFANSRNPHLRALATREPTQATAALYVPEKRISRSDAEDLQEDVAKAIAAYIQETVGTQRVWMVTPTISEDFLALLNKGRISSVTGGSHPWDGQMQFYVKLAMLDGSETSIPVVAEVAPQQMVLMAKYKFPRGHVLAAQDVELLPVEKGRKVSDACTDVSQILGKELIRAVSNGQPILAQTLKNRTLVRRREAVTLKVKVGTVEVTRHDFYAESDAGLGDWVSIINGQGGRKQKPLRAVVIGPQQVEIVK